MIFYFSGTGNSKWIAQEIAKRTGDEAVEMAALRKIGAPHYEPAHGDTVGFVFPIHAWRAPQYVTEFAAGMTFDDSNFVYAVGTCGSEAGKAMARFAETVPLKSAYTFQMPNNYVKSYPVDSPERIESCIHAAKAMLPEICQEITEKIPTFRVEKGKFSGLKTSLIGGAFTHFALRTVGFVVDNTCTSCGKCVEVCPLETISLVQGKPLWKKACTQCAGCINICPVGAITDGEKSKTTGRYYFDRDGAKFL